MTMPTSKGSSVQDVGVSSEGQGAKQAFGSSNSGVDVQAVGSTGLKVVSGGSEGSVPINTEQEGIKIISEGSERTVEITTEGLGESYILDPSDYHQRVIVTVQGGKVDSVLQMTGSKVVPSDIVGPKVSLPEIEGQQATTDPTIEGPKVDSEIEL